MPDYITGPGNYPERGGGTARVTDQYAEGRFCGWNSLEQPMCWQTDGETISDSSEYDIVGPILAPGSIDLPLSLEPGEWEDARGVAVRITKPANNMMFRGEYPDGSVEWFNADGRTDYPNHRRYIVRKKQPTA